jgi:hypothetical protein
MIDFADFNVKLLIAYALFLIVGLLIYIAFYKGSSRQK